MRLMYQRWLPVGLAALRAHSMPWRSISGRLPHPLSPGPHNISERYLPSGLGAWVLGGGRRPGLSSCLSLDLPWMCLFLLVPSSMSASSPLLPAHCPPPTQTSDSSTPSPQGSRLSERRSMCEPFSVLPPRPSIKSHLPYLCCS